MYSFFERYLEGELLALGTEGKDWDEERKPVDTVVIHHTKGGGGMTWQRLSAMHLLRLYARSYLSPSTEKEIQGLPIYSNHFRYDDPTQMVFYAYHWLVRANGTAERLLNDDEIGWHAGNWDINCRSVAICLDGNFENETPSLEMLDGVRNIIMTYYAHVRSDRIIPPQTRKPQNNMPR